MKKIHKKWLLSLQTTTKAKGALCKINEEKKECACCLGVLANTLEIKRKLSPNSGFYEYIFNQTEKFDIFEDYERVGLFDQTGGFENLELALESAPLPRLNSLALLNDRTSLTHKEISIFIYVFRDYILKLGNPPKKRKKLKFKDEKELIASLHRRAKRHRFAQKLKEWELELAPTS